MFFNYKYSTIFNSSIVVFSVWVDYVNWLEFCPAIDKEILELSVHKNLCEIDKKMHSENNKSECTQRFSTLRP